MKVKLLIFAIYAAPYRTDLFQSLSQEFETTVFYEMSQGDQRNDEYFKKKQNDYFLDTAVGVSKFKEAKRNLKEYDLVALYDWSSKVGCSLILSCKIKNIPFVVNCDGVILQEHGSAIKEIAKRIILKGASACLASGQYAKKYFLRYGLKENQVHIHGFTTLHKEDILECPMEALNKTELRHTLGLPADGKLAIAVGRFIPLKRYDALIRAWRVMADDQYLLLIGGGPEEQNYRKIIAELKLANVIVDGYHDKDELKLFYQAADVFVHPTSYDAWGLVINEAMANGLPVVASDHCVAALELIHSGENGFVVPVDDNAQIQEAIQLVFSNSGAAKKMAQKGLESIQSYTIENMAHTHMQVFKSILRGNNEIVY